MNKSYEIARKFIVQSDLDKAIKVLLDASEGKKIHKEIILISSKFQRLQKELLLGSLSPEEFSIDSNELAEKLLIVVDNLEYIERNHHPEPPLRSFLFLNIFIALFEIIVGALNSIYNRLLNKPFERINLLLNKKKFIKVRDRLVKWAEVNENLVEEVTFIRSKESITIKVIIEGNFESQLKTVAKEFINSIRFELELRGEINVKSIEKGSVVISLEMSSEDAEKLYLAIKLQKLKELEIKEARLVGFKPIEQNELSDLTEIKEKIKREIAKNFEVGLTTLENLLNKRSKHYNELILIKSSYNQSNKMFNHGLLNFDTFKVQMNRFIKSLIDMVEDLVSVDVNQKK